MGSELGPAVDLQQLRIGPSLSVTGSGFHPAGLATRLGSRPPLPAPDPLMPYYAYRFIHLFGIFALIVTLGAAAMHGLKGGTRKDNPWRMQLGTAHGVALFLILLGGFGMLARLGMAQGGLPNWIYIKLVIWLIFGGALTAAYKGKAAAMRVLIFTPLLGLLAAMTAWYKPWS